MKLEKKKLLKVKIKKKNSIKKQKQKTQNTIIVDIL
jgi:hypothetical protein